jgi:hypothetical protein
MDMAASTALPTIKSRFDFIVEFPFSKAGRILGAA